MDYAGRLKRLRAMMCDGQCDAMLITNPYNRRYMTGFTGTAGYVLVTDSEAVLMTDFRYREQAPREVVGFTVVEHDADIQASLAQWLREHKVDTVGVESATLTHQEYAQLEVAFEGMVLLPTQSWVEQLRIVKDEAEIAIMQRAANLADATFTHILDFIKPGVAERDIALEIEFFMRKNGATSSSFDTIVASGPRSALPHGVASERLIGQNEFVKLDFGAYMDGYCSDITRTVFVGTPTDKHKAIYNIVLEAQQAGLGGVRPGLRGREADALTRDVIKGYGYSGFFGHGTGHGLGMEIHEAPRLSMTSETVLTEGMVVTVEPGIYLPDFGGVRIEDDVYLTKDGAVRMTQSTKAWIVL